MCRKQRYRKRLSELVDAKSREYVHEPINSPNKEIIAKQYFRLKRLENKSK